MCLVFNTVKTNVEDSLQSNSGLKVSVKIQQNTGLDLGNYPYPYPDFGYLVAGYTQLWCLMKQHFWISYYGQREWPCIVPPQTSFVFKLYWNLFLFGESNSNFNIGHTRLHLGSCLYPNPPFGNLVTDNQQLWCLIRQERYTVRIKPKPVVWYNLIHTDPQRKSLAKARRNLYFSYSKIVSSSPVFKLWIEKNSIILFELEHVSGKSQKYRLLDAFLPCHPTPPGVNRILSSSAFDFALVKFWSSLFWYF